MNLNLLTVTGEPILANSDTTEFSLEGTMLSEIVTLEGEFSRHSARLNSLLTSRAAIHKSAAVDPIMIACLGGAAFYRNIGINLEVYGTMSPAGQKEYCLEGLGTTITETIAKVKAFMKRVWDLLVATFQKIFGRGGKVERQAAEVEAIAKEMEQIPAQPVAAPVTPAATEPKSEPIDYNLGLPEMDQFVDRMAWLGYLANKCIDVSEMKTFMADPSADDRSTTPNTTYADFSVYATRWVEEAGQSQPPAAQYFEIKGSAPWYEMNAWNPMNMAQTVVKMSAYMANTGNVRTTWVTEVRKTVLAMRAGSRITTQAITWNQAYTAKVDEWLDFYKSAEANDTEGIGRLNAKLKFYSDIIAFLRFTLEKMAYVSYLTAGESRRVMQIVRMYKRSATQNA